MSDIKHISDEHLIVTPSSEVNEESNTAETSPREVSTSTPYLYPTNSDAELSKDIETPSRSCCSRWCSPIRAGSLRGAAFSICSVTFGAGCLMFPKAVQITGPILAIVILLSMGGASVYTEKVLVSAAVKAKIYDYDKLTLHTMGRGMVIFYDVNNIIFIIGVIMTFQKAMYDFGENLINIVFGVEKGTMVRLYLMVASTVLLQIPIGLLKDISKLQYASIVATFCLITTVLVIDLESPLYIWYNIKNNVQFPSLFPKFDWSNNNYLDTFSIFLFGFSCHNGILNVLEEMKNPNKKRCNKVLNISFVLEVILYGTIGFCGYFSTLSKTPDYFLTREDLPYFKDYFIILAQFTLFICLHCSCAVNFNIMRWSVQNICLNGKKMNMCFNVPFTIFIYCLCNAFVFFLSEMNSVLGIFSGFSNIVICFVIPIVAYLKVNLADKGWGHKLIPYTILVVMIIIGTACSIKSSITCVQDLIHGVK